MIGRVSVRKDCGPEANERTDFCPVAIRPSTLKCDTLKRFALRSAVLGWPVHLAGRYHTQKVKVIQAATVDAAKDGNLWVDTAEPITFTRDSKKVGMNSPTYHQTRRWLETFVCGFSETRSLTHHS